MFEQLRNRFLMLNMAITTLVMALAFLAVYLVSYGNLQRQTLGRLEKMDSLQVKAVAAPDGPAQGESGAPAIVTHRNMLSPKDEVSFTIVMNGQADALTVSSFVNLPDSAYKSAAAGAANARGGVEMMDIEGRTWAFRAAPAMRAAAAHRDGNEWPEAPADQGAGAKAVAFVDVTAEMAQLRNLPRLFALVGLPMLVLIFLVSLAVASRTIAPVREAWDRQRRFVADASHELKTPLSIIQANCDALQCEPEPVEAAKWVSYIRVGADRMALLVSGLLSLAQIEDGRGEGRVESFDMGDLVAEVAASMQPLARERDIRLEVTAEGSIRPEADREQVARIASALMENALKYADEGGRVCVRLARGRRAALLEVENTGPGIAPSDVPRVFDRFFRGDPSRAAGGQGLGLSIAKALADRMGAALACESEPAVLTVFRFTLPMN